MAMYENVLNLFPRLDGIRNYIFEVDLSAPTPKPDFSLCFVKSEVTGLLTHWRAINQRFANNTLWRRLVQFVSQWREEGTSLNKHIADVWFEFDHHQLEKQLPEPCFFFSPRGLSRPPGESSKKINAQWLWETALPLLDGNALSQKVKENISLCLEALPGKSNIFQVGKMMARNNPEPLIRLCTSLPIHLYTQFLETIGWKGSLRDLKNFLILLSRYVDSVFVDIDIGEQVSTPIGLECSFPGTGDTEIRIHELLIFLIDQQLAVPENAEIVQTWIRKPHSPIPFNCNLEEMANKRTLSHIKVIFNTNKPSKAKAYLLI